jgi:hypothetical protein
VNQRRISGLQGCLQCRWPTHQIHHLWSNRATNKK